MQINLYRGGDRVSARYCSHVWSQLLIPVCEGELQCGRFEISEGWTRILIVQDQGEKATMDRQPAAVVVDKAKLPELIHEMTDPRASCADHLCQAFLIDSGNYSFGSGFLAKMSKQQKNPSQTLLARVEKLIDQVFFVSDVARKQMRDEQLRDVVLLVEHAGYRRFVNPGKTAIGDRDSR